MTCTGHALGYPGFVVTLYGCVHDQSFSNPINRKRFSFHLGRNKPTGHSAIQLQSARRLAATNFVADCSPIYLPDHNSGQRTHARHPKADRLPVNFACPRCSPPRSTKHLVLAGIFPKTVNRGGCWTRNQWVLAGFRGGPFWTPVCGGRVEVLGTK